MTEDKDATIARLTDERYRLAYAICGGEDAPGLLDSTTVEQLEQIAWESHSCHLATIDRSLRAEALLAEKEAAEARANTLTTEKHADAEAIGALEAKLAEVTAERDEAESERQEQARLLGMSAERELSLTARVEEAECNIAKSRDEGFAQGIEAAAQLHEQLWRETDAYKRDRIRALSPTPKADPNREAAQEEFAAYFRRNYPGPDTIIYDPDWHAPRIFRAALRALAQKGE